MNRRSAIATLELVLALPVILVMLVALVWLGFSVVGQADVTVQARHQAWSRRFEAWEQTPFTFSADQSVTGNATTAVKVSPLLDGFGDPESSHVATQGNWDHRSVDFQSVPNWRLYADVGIAAKREGLLAQYEDARAKMESLESIGSTALADALRQVAEDLINPGGRLKSDGDNRERRLELDRDLEEQKKAGQDPRLGIRNRKPRANHRSIEGVRGRGRPRSTVARRTKTRAFEDLIGAGEKR